MPQLTLRATGTFDVKLEPQPGSPTAPHLARFLLTKHFYGDLEAESLGHMLSASTSTRGSAGYVAIEAVTGALAGKSGSFVLQHAGTMERGAPTLTIHVVPDSGTDALTGLSGTMAIDLSAGHHAYTFDYALPDPA